MRALALLAMLSGCTANSTPDAGATPCETIFPALRVDTACGVDLQVFLDGREEPPTPRRLDIDGGVILPWPDWAMEGMPSYAISGTARVDFTAHPYMCEEISLSCP